MNIDITFPRDDYDPKCVLMEHFTQSAPLDDSQTGQTTRREIILRTFGDQRARVYVLLLSTPLSWRTHGCPEGRCMGMRPYVRVPNIVCMLHIILMH